MMRKPVNYEEAAAYLGAVPMFVAGRNLAHTEALIRRLGGMELDRKVIHVAGTNGKGSVCAYMQAILETEGKKTGFFTSPHLISMNERIQINRTPITDEAFYHAFEKVYAVVEVMTEEGYPPPHFSEYMLGMGVVCFLEADVDYVILETGLGGRMDATNVFAQPALTVITSISLDHTAYLGDTVEQIAAEKAGIIKAGVPLCFDGNVEAVSEILQNTAEKYHAPCVKVTKNAFEILEVTRKRIAFSRVNAYDKDVIWEVPICGIYQVMNAELALQAVTCLLGEKLAKRSERRWRDAAAKVRWSGRMERYADHFIIDGAHNPGAIEAFVETVQALHEPELPVILFSAVADKKYEVMIQYLCEHLEAAAYIVTEIPGGRNVSAEVLGEVFRRYTDRPVYIHRSCEDAVREALRVRTGESYIYAIGSLYLVSMLENLQGIR